MEHTLLDLTHSYIDAFHNKKIDVIMEMLAENATLRDPGVTLESKMEILDFVAEIFASNNILEFVATKVMAFDDQNFSIIEFKLKIGNKTDGGASQWDEFTGTDHITWNKNGEIEHLEAFLY
jgi:ketosteroid isomerase-like protein